MKYSLRSLMTFSIRDMLWLMAVVALALGWWCDRSHDIWRHRAGTLEQYLRERHYLQVMWCEDELVVGHSGVADHIKVSDQTEPSVVRSNQVPTSQAPAPNPPKE